MEAQNLVGEVWKIIPSNENYSVSNLGRVKRNKTNRILESRKSWHGYAMITYRAPTLSSQLVNKLVLEAFHKPRPVHYFGPTKKAYAIYHKNGNRMDCRLSNLQYMTRGEILTLYWKDKPHGIVSLRKGKYDPTKPNEKRIHRPRMPNQFQA